MLPEKEWEPFKTQFAAIRVLPEAECPANLPRVALPPAPLAHSLRTGFSGAAPRPTHSHRPGTARAVSGEGTLERPPNPLRKELANQRANKCPGKKRNFFEGFPRWIVKQRAAGDGSPGGGCVVWAHQTKPKNVSSYENVSPHPDPGPIDPDLLDLRRLRLGEPFPGAAGGEFLESSLG